MVAILRLCETAGLDRLTAALETARKHHVYDVESVRAILTMDQPASTVAPVALPPEHLQRWPEVFVRTVESDAYDWLLTGATGGAAE